MRITAVELQYEDIMWFGIDNQDHIFECTSAGSGNVPEFVCESKEKTNTLLDFFMLELREFTKEKLFVEYVETNQLIKDCILLSRKGIVCFDAFENTKGENQYVKIAEPETPLTFDELPPKIKDIFRNHKINVDILKEKFIYVEHAY